jgi:hypothetical protein
MAAGCGRITRKGYDFRKVSALIGKTTGRKRAKGIVFAPICGNNDAYFDPLGKHLFVLFIIDGRLVPVSLVNNNQVSSGMHLIPNFITVLLCELARHQVIS